LNVQKNVEVAIKRLSKEEIFEELIEANIKIYNLNKQIATRVKEYEAALNEIDRLKEEITKLKERTNENS